MFFRIKPLFFLVLLSVIFLVGCNSNSSRKEEALSLSIDSGPVINFSNRSNYTFSGSCVEAGVANIEYSVVSSGSAQGTSPLTGSIDCTDGTWELSLSGLSALSDGEITLSLSYSEFSASLSITQDTSVPVLSVSYDSVNQSFGLSCTGESACDTGYRYRWAINTNSSHTFGSGAAFSALQLSSLLNGLSSDGNEDYYWHVQAKDEAGNISSAVKTPSFRFDTVLPVVLSVTAVSNNAVDTSYGKESDTVTLTVSFNDEVSAQGTPELNLGSGRRAGCTDCSSGGAKTSLNFSYQVQNTDSGGLEFVGFVFGSGEGISDGAGAVVNPTSPMTVSGLTLDNTSPSVTNIVKANKSHVWSWDWDCSETCRYRHEITTSQTPPGSLTGNYIATATASPPGSDGTYYVHVQARDGAGHESAIATGSASILVGGAPTITKVSGPADQTYSTGAFLDFEVTFDRSVTVTGTPQLPLQIGDQSKNADYSSGSASNTLTFRYTVVAGDVDDNGVALGSSGAINLNGGQLNNGTGSVSFTAKTFAGVLVDAVLPAVAITSTHTDEITGSNAAAYQVSGTCKAGLSVRVRVGSAAPASAPTCTASKTWAATLNVGNLPKGETTITASQTNPVGTGSATSVTVTVGDFEQLVMPLAGIALGEYNTGSGHGCVVQSDGTLKCWGDNTKGQLGNNSRTASTYPVGVVRDTAGQPLEDIVDVTTSSGAFACALKEDGRVVCWGYGRDGRLGQNSQTDSWFPKFVKGVNNSGTLGGIVQISSSFYHTCALGSNGQVHCWGSNIRHQLGNSAVGNQTRYPRTVKVSATGPPLEGIVQIASGGTHTCALDSIGKVWCWGSQKRGLLGDGVSYEGNYPTTEIYPVAVRDSSGASGSTLGGVIQIAAGETGTCALKNDGTVLCWGQSFLGTSSDYFTSSAHPLLLNLSDMKSISVSFGNTTSGDVRCALDSDGRPKCWGDNRGGQLTKGVVDGNSINSPLHEVLPITLKGGSNGGVLQGVSGISFSAQHGCALMVTGKIKCWGSHGSIGVGGGGWTLYPVDLPSSSSNPEFVPGNRLSSVVCRKNFSKCVLNSLSLAPDGAESNFIMNGASPTIRVYGLGDGESLSLYSDSACLTALSGGNLSGDSNTNPQTVDLSNTVTNQEVLLYYKRDGHAEINNTLCWKSPMIFDRVLPPAPTGVSFSGGTSFSSPPDRVRVAVTVGSADSMKEYTAKVYLENSSCDNDSDLVAEGTYHHNTTLNLNFLTGTPNYSWNAYDPNGAPTQQQAFQFYAQSVDAVGNISTGCTASAQIWLHIPNPGF